MTLLVMLTAACVSNRGPVHQAFIDRTGAVILRLPPQHWARSFSEGLAAVSVNGKYGFIDRQGKFVIPPQFGGVREFHEGLAAVTSADSKDYWKPNTLFGFIDKTGQYVIPAKFNWVGDFSEGLAPVCTGVCRGGSANGLTGYIDRLGKQVIPPQFSSAARFSGGLAAAAMSRAIGADHGYINRLGKFVIQPRFFWVGAFVDGLAATNHGFIDKTGQVVIPRTSRNGALGFSGGLAAVELDGRTAYIDTTGQIKLRSEFESAGDFAEGLAPACVFDCGPSTSSQNWGFMDENGKMVIKPQFGFVPEPFHEGLALVCFGCTG